MKSMLIEDLAEGEGFRAFSSQMESADDSENTENKGN
jgi:hypothetical protein